MIEKLFSSKTRVAILKLFLFNAYNSFYQRQISNLTNQPIRGVQREVDKLHKAGLLEKFAQGNRIYYRVDKKCPIVGELKSILFKTAGIAEVLKVNLKEKEIKFAFIYGSYAKGQENFLSDIDLIVIGDISPKELSGSLSKPKRELMREINYIVFPVEEFIARVRKKDHFLSSVIKEKKIFIVGDGNEFKDFIKSRQIKAA